MHVHRTAPRWMSGWLKAAAIYNVLWGALTIFYPNWLFDLTGMQPPTYPFIWQVVGMIVGVYGVGYWIAATDPYRHWPIVLVGTLGKLFGPAGYATGLLLGGTMPFVSDVPPEFGVTLITNDLIWWIPFALILLGAARNAHGRGAADATDPATAMGEFTDRAGVTLLERTNEAPTLVVFLRHAGCTFCKEALADLAAQRDKIEARGVRLALVSMTEQHNADAWLAGRALDDIPHYSDPARRLYASFGLTRGTLAQAFGPKAIARGAEATIRGHLVGKLAGDGFQMPGVFLVRNGEITHAFRHQTVADRPDYAELACAPAPVPSPPNPAPAHA